MPKYIKAVQNSLSFAPKKSKNQFAALYSSVGLCRLHWSGQFPQSSTDFWKESFKVIKERELGNNYFHYFLVSCIRQPTLPSTYNEARYQGPGDENKNKKLLSPFF